MGLKMYNLEACVDKAIESGAKYFAVVVSIHGKNEIIVNEVANAKSKLDYYKVAYSKELVLNSSEGIRIVGFTYGNTFHQIEVDLFGKGEK